MRVKRPVTTSHAVANVDGGLEVDVAQRCRSLVHTSWSIVSKYFLRRTCRYTLCVKVRI